MKSTIINGFNYEKGLNNRATAYNVKELASYMQQMKSRFFGLTTKDLRKMAYDLAEKNNLQHNFDLHAKMTGKIWQNNYFKRS